MGQVLAGTGYFSILRWRKSAVRDEAKNIAVVLISEDKGFSGVRHAPPSAISTKEREQGVLDALLVGLEQRFSSLAPKDAIEGLNYAVDSLGRSLYFTDPEPAFIPSVPKKTLDDLYRAYVSPRPRAVGKSVSKAKILDEIIPQLRKAQDLSVKRSDYVGDYIFDIVLNQEGGATSVMEVFTFATGAKNFLPVIHDAGYFMLGLKETETPGVAIVKAPLDGADDEAHSAHEWVLRKLRQANIPQQSPDEITNEQPALVPV